MYSSYLPNYKITKLPSLILIDHYPLNYSLEDFSDTLSTILSNFYNKITFSEDLLNHFVKIDLFYQKKLKEQYDNYFSVFMSLSVDEVKAANKLFLNTESTSIPNLKDFLSMLRAFPVVADDVIGIINKCLVTTNVTEISTVDDLFNGSNLSNYEELGIEIIDNSIDFDFPFSKNPPDIFVNELGYSSLSDICTIFHDYEYQVDGSLKKLLRFKNYLVKQYAQLKTEMSSSEEDYEKVKLHFRAVLFTATVVCNLVGKLLTVHRNIMYKMKAVLDAGIKSVLPIINQRD